MLCATRVHGAGASVVFPDSDLTNATERVARSRERLDLQLEPIQNARADRHDTEDAEAVFRTVLRTLENPRKALPPNRRRPCRGDKDPESSQGCLLGSVARLKGDKEAEVDLRLLTEHRGHR